MPRPPATIPPTAFGERLIAACKLRGLSLRQLGLKAGYSKARPFQLTRTKRPDRETVEKLAAILGVDRSDLDPDLTPQKNT